MKSEFYGEYFEVEDRHWWFIGRRKILLQVLSDHLDGAAGRLEILDFGCGTGTMLEHLGAFGDARGVDADPAAVEFCHRRGVEAVEHVPPGPLPHAGGSFDLVTALDVLEHIPDDRFALSELLRVLKPGGTLLVAVPAMPFLWGPQDEISHHERRYVLRQLRERLVSGGFTVDRLTFFNTLLFPPIAAIRVLRPTRRGSDDVTSDFAMTSPDSLANRVLARVFSSEAALLRRTDLPFGVSLLALAQKPTAAA
jgi:SAM-dependent methyltransferase